MVFGHFCQTITPRTCQRSARTRVVDVIVYCWRPQHGTKRRFAQYDDATFNVQFDPSVQITTSGA
jgi:hypothetical protein